MFKNRYAILSILVAALVGWQPMPGGVDTASGGIDGDSSMSWLDYGANTCMFTCPLGDGRTLAEFGTTIGLRLKTITGVPIPGVPATDIWLVGCTGSVIIGTASVVLCHGGASIDADAATDEFGETTISGGAYAGGCDIGVVVVVQGAQIADWNGGPLCLPLPVKSVDQKGDGLIDAVDVGLFSESFPFPDPLNPGMVYDHCADFNCDQLIDVRDVASLSEHWAAFPAPPHNCTP